MLIPRFGNEVRDAVKVNKELEQKLEKARYARLNIYKNIY
jgi:hypothetical protein